MWVSKFLEVFRELYNTPTNTHLFGYCDEAPHIECGGTPQCFDNVSPSLVINTNDVISWHDDCTCTVAPTPTATETSTPTPANTGTPTQTPDPTNTPTNTETPTQTPDPTNTPTNTETPTQTPDPTNTPTNTETPTPTPPPSNTPTTTTTLTATETPSNTPTTTTTLTTTQTPSANPTNTPTQTPSLTPELIIQFKECDTNFVFRFAGSPMPYLPVNSVYLIEGSLEFSGCATVVTYTNEGPLYNSSGVTFTEIDYCGNDTFCPRTNRKAATLAKCYGGELGYFMVDVDTAFQYGVYFYQGDCWEFIRFDGPGGPYLGSPEYKSCTDSVCIPSPTPTVTPRETPTQTPTPSPTPSACTYSTFCFRTTLPELEDYSGSYTESGYVYNGQLTYSGDGVNTAVIYYFTSVTESYWCLSDTLGGTCILRGSSPCETNCPDISGNFFDSGVCPTPTPSPSACTIDFTAYFDCDWEPIPTPSPTIGCDDVDFTFNNFALTPTPTGTNPCTGKAVDFSLYVSTPTPTQTPTSTPYLLPPSMTPAGGKVSFGIFDSPLDCPDTKIIKICGEETLYYVVGDLIFNNAPIAQDVPFSGNLNGQVVCAEWIGTTSQISSNSIISQIYSIHATCGDCTIQPTPTSTTTQTPTKTPTNTPTQTITPTVTATNTPTPSKYTTPTPTPSITATVTPSNSPTSSTTPTPSPTKDPVYYVFTLCPDQEAIIRFNRLYQSSPLTVTVPVGKTFMDDNGYCWTYQGPTTVQVPNPIYMDMIWNGNYFGTAGSDQYDTCTECLTVNTKITLQFKVFENFNGYIPSGATTTFESPNFGASFYDGLNPNDGFLFFPATDVLNDGVIVGGPITLVGSNPYNISKMAVGAIHASFRSKENIIVSVYINGVLASQKTQFVEASEEDFGIQVDGLFEQINCISTPCLRQLNRGNILLITIEKGEAG